MDRQLEKSSVWRGKQAYHWLPSVMADAYYDIGFPAPTQALELGVEVLAFQCQR